MAKECALSCMGYGYEVKIRVNGTDIGVVGGKSESKRLFAADHEMAAQMPPDLRKKLAVLKDGPDRIEIEFRKTGGPTDSLTVEIMTEDIDPVFAVKSSARQSGKVDRAVDFSKPGKVLLTDADL